MKVLISGGGIAELLAEEIPGLGDDDRRALAAYYFALVNGLAVVWLIDPSIVPSGAQLTRLLPPPVDAADA